MVIDELRKKWALASGLATTEFEGLFNYGRDCLSCNVIDNKSLEILERILALGNKLKPVGNDDDCRSFWMCVVEDDEDYKKDGYLDRWYRVSLGRYRDHHSIMVTDRSFQGASFANVETVGDKREDVKAGWNVSRQLLGIEKYLTEILKDVPAYNDFVNCYLPYRKRVGVISRKDLLAIDPSYDRFKDIDKKATLALLDECKEDRPCGVEKMTLREYARLWTIGYKAYCLTEENGRKTVNDGEDSLDTFKKHSSEGYKLLRDNGGYDPDSEEDFVRWLHDSTPYHSLDICYARIHFTPERRPEDGKWCLTLHAHAYGWLPDMVRIAFGYKEVGIPVTLEPNDKLRSILNEADFVQFSPCPGKYIGYGEVTNDTYLPYVGEREGEVSQETYDRLVAAAKWEIEGILELAETNE